MEEFRKELLNLQQCMNEAVLYAEQSSYEQLQELMAKVLAIVPVGKKTLTIDTDDSADLAAGLLAGSTASVEAVHTLVRTIKAELSKPVRKMLGLKKIVLKVPNE